MDQPNFGNKKRKPGMPAQPGEAGVQAPLAQPPASAAPAEQAKENGFAVPQRTREVHPKRVWPD